MQSPGEMLDYLSVIYVRICDKLKRVSECELLSFPLAMHMFLIKIRVI